MKEKIIFIDWHKTICNNEIFDEVRKSNDRTISNLYTELVKLLFIESHEMVIDWMKGEYVSEEIIEFCSKKVDIPYNLLWDLFIKGCDNLEIEPSIVRSIECCKSKYKIILVTDNMDFFDRFVRPQIHNNLFDDIVNSYSSGYLKSDQNGYIFRAKAIENNCSIEDTYLLDDNKNIINLFNLLGGTGIQINSLFKTKFVLNELNRKIYTENL